VNNRRISNGEQFFMMAATSLAQLVSPGRKAISGATRLKKTSFALNFAKIGVLF
jgi:hypothetical protein